MMGNLDCARCPYCDSSLKIEITRHALERLEERAYLKFFKTSAILEDKAKWLMRFCREAVEQGTLLKSEEPGIVKYWHKGLELCFGSRKDILTLITLLHKNQPRKEYWEERSHG